MNSLNPTKLTSAITYIDTWLEANFANSRLPGMQIAILHKDSLLYSRAFGVATIASNQPLTTNNVFRIASHSKTFTATAIMQLVEAGHVCLDDAVSKYLPWFTSSVDGRVASVTLRQLMNHTAGVMRDGVDADYWQVLREFPNETELRDFVANSQLVYDTDTQFKYSNYGYGFLGMVIAKVSGVSYRDYVTQHIVDTLGLTSTGPDLDDTAITKLATGYGREMYRRERQTFGHIDTQALSSATGFYSNAEDVCRYFSAHFIGTTALISDASKRTMQHGYWDAKDDGEKYGLGMIHYPRNGWKLYGHSGGFPGFITDTQFDAQKQLVVSVLTNCYDGNASQVCKKIINIIDIFQQDADTSRQHTHELRRFEGRFYVMWGIIDIVAVGNKLFTVNPLEWAEFDAAEELEVVDDTTLRIKKASGYSAPGEEIIYSFDKDGRATECRYGGYTMVSHEKAVTRGWFST